MQYYFGMPEHFGIPALRAVLFKLYKNQMNYFTYCNDNESATYTLAKITLAITLNTLAKIICAEDKLYSINSS